MTYKEIFEMEDNNTCKVYLHLEGTFLRAHNQSAYLLCRDVTAFKVSWRVIKKENRDDYSVGFPFEARGKWLHKFVVKEISPDHKLYEITALQPLNEPEYQHWCEMARALSIDPKQQHSRVTRLIESQPVYKTAQDVMMQVLDISANVSKRRTIVGQRAANQAMDLCIGMLHFYDAPDRAAEAIRLQMLCRDLSLMLYVLEEKKECSHRAYAELTERIDSIRGQAGALAKSAKTADTT